MTSQTQITNTLLKVALDVIREHAGDSPEDIAPSIHHAKQALIEHFRSVWTANRSEIDTGPAPNDAVIMAIVRKYQNLETLNRIFSKLVSDSLLGCWYYDNEIFFGVEPDGYIHT